MPPANDDVAAIDRVSMVSEIAALILKLYPYPLPFTGSNLPLRFAIGIAGLHGLDQITQFPGHYSEQKHDALFVHRLMPKTPKIDRIAVGGRAVQLTVLEPRQQNARRCLAIVEQSSS